MSHAYHLYASPDSANLVIRMLLHELGIKFDTIWLNRNQQEHKQADYLALNPQGLIPVLLDNQQPIFETAAIILHLCDQHQSLAPQTGIDRPRFLQWLMYLSNTPHADLRARFYSDRYIQGKAEQAALRQGMGQRFQQHLKLIEQHLASNPQAPWFLGQQFSALDIYLGALCRWWQLYPGDEAPAPISQHTLPHLYELLSQLSQRPAIIAACAEESITAPLFIAPQTPDLPPEMITG